jgi:nitrogen fixation/metabolism regulation signal transduction histidine kinase
MREDANRMAAELFRYAAANARSESDSIAAELSESAVTASNKPSPAALAEAQHVLQRHEVSLQGGFALLYRFDNASHGAQVVAAFHVPQSPAGSTELKALQPAETSTDESPDPTPVIVETRLPGPIDQAILQAAQRNDNPFYTIAGTDYTLATSSLKHGGLIVAALPIPTDIAATSVRLRTSADEYWTLFRERRQIRNLYMALLLLTTGLALFAICWLALNLSKQVTRPIESLADAMEAIAAGDYAHRVGESATEELGELVDSFNAMASDLQSAHETAARSTLQLSELNYALQERRTELETIIETIPNGVATLSAEREIVLANRAFSEMFDPGGQKSFIGLAITDIFPTDVASEIPETLDRLLRRAHRMGSASAEMEMPSASGTRNLSATVALLEGPAAATRSHLGYVLVMEDATELLRAQKQSAWKEVARRVAHEIKNPLTPISLNAELILRHVGRLNTLLTQQQLESPSPAVIQRGSEVISSSVETMRSLVDQFSALAEFPTAQPRPTDLNTIVDKALALFAGRLGNIRVIRSLDPRLPLILGDAEALKRALSNLIDNAAEAMQNSLLRELRISTRVAPSGLIELTLADTGPGLTDEMRDRLFLPYFSTKQRGTGLGLSIAAKILQEHQGSIRAEKNIPAGARFILELRPAPADSIATPDTATPSTEVLA